MRTYEQQVKNINIARGRFRPAMIDAIRTSGYGKQDTENREEIIGAESLDEAMRLYDDADTAVREALQYVIEETTNGRTKAETEQLTKRYQVALEQIGGAAVLMTLPGPIKKILEKTTDLKVKTEMLEAIAEIKTM